MNPLHIQSRCFSNCCFWAAFPLKKNLSHLQLLGALGCEPHFFSRVWGACVSAAGPRGVLPDPGYRSLPPLGDLQNLDATPPARAGDAGMGSRWDRGHPPPCPRGPPARAAGPGLLLQVFSSRNRSVWSWRLGVSLRGGEFKVSLYHQLEPPL